MPEESKSMLHIGYVLENGLTARKYLKEGIKLIIESEGNLVVIVIRLSKKQLISILDKLIPD